MGKMGEKSLWCAVITMGVAVIMTLDGRHAH